jgi:hypothetical protein
VLSGRQPRLTSGFVYVALMVVAVIIAGTGFALVIEGFRQRPRTTFSRHQLFSLIESVVSDDAAKDTV